MGFDGHDESSGVLLERLVLTILVQTTTFDNRRNARLERDYNMQREQKSRTRGSELVTAAEIASFVYCPEQWRLESGLGLPPGNRAVLDAGTRHHERKAVAEQVAGGSIGLGQVLVAVAVVVLVLLWMVWR
jgi:hypothetical protein